MLMQIAVLMMIGLAASWLVLFPAGRALGNRLASRTRDGVGSAFSGASRSTQHCLSRLGGIGTDTGSRLGRHWREHRIHWLAAALAVCLPPLLVSQLHRATPLEAPSARPSDEHIAHLLRGERLAPPPPLPPEVFTTREVERIRPELAGANREWAQLDPEFRNALLLIFDTMRSRHGYELVLLEGYRSPERQQRLAAMGAHVTNAGMYQSYHQFGLAADVAFLRNGQVVISERDPWAMQGYELYGETAESLGLTWGGRWRMRDYGHVELRRPGARTRPTDGNL